MVARLATAYTSQTHITELSRPSELSLHIARRSNGHNRIQPICLALQYLNTHIIIHHIVDRLLCRENHTTLIWAEIEVAGIISRKQTGRLVIGNSSFIWLWNIAVCVTDVMWMVQMNATHNMTMGGFLDSVTRIFFVLPLKWENLRGRGSAFFSEPKLILHYPVRYSWGTVIVQEYQAHFLSGLTIVCTEHVWGRSRSPAFLYHVGATQPAGWHIFQRICERISLNIYPRCTINAQLYTPASYVSCCLKRQSVVKVPCCFRRVFCDWLPVTKNPKKPCSHPSIIHYPSIVSI